MFSFPFYSPHLFLSGFAANCVYNVTKIWKLSPFIVLLRLRWEYCLMGSPYGMGCRNSYKWYWTDRVCRRRETIWSPDVEMQ